MTTLSITPLRLAALIGIALATFAGNGLATITIPDVPLFMNSTGVKPNFVMTLDDSGSMQWAYVPDNRSGDSSTNRFKSYYFNGMYYNPNVQYYPPPKYNGGNCTLDASNPATCYPNASYTGAYINGFDTTRGSVDLSTDYRAVKSYSPSNTTQTFAGSPSGSSDRSYYGSSASTVTHLAYVCKVKFNKTSGEERIEILACPGTENIFSSNDDGQALTVSCLSSDGCSGLNEQYLHPYDGNGDPIPYTINYYSDNNNSDKIRVGEQSWTSDKTQEYVRLEWDRPSSSSTTYPGYYYLFYSEAGVSLPGSCTATTANQKTDDDCYVRIWVGDTADIYKNPNASSASAAQKKQNFANWYTYYRTRNLSLVSGTMHALTGLDGTSRVAWQAINTCNTFSSSSCKGWDNPSTGVDNRIRQLDQTLSNSKTHRQELYDWLARFPANGGTPLRTAAQRAGDYFDTTVTALSATSPWAENPPSTVGTYHACRRSLQLLMTDGIWNSDSISSYGNKTNTTFTLPSGTKLNDGTSFSSWTPGRPYTDSNSDSLADIAIQYWAKDLAPTLDNKLTPLYPDRSGTATSQWNNPKNDPATWQHLNTYGISLGLGSVLVSPNATWGGDTYSGGYAGLLSGTYSWPATGSSNSPGNAYDLWHASLSGRGQFYSAESSDDLKSAFKSVVDSVTAIASAGGGAGLVANATKIANDTTAYLATFSGDWSASFQSLPVQSDSSLGAPYWDAGQIMPFAANRNIFTLNDGSAQTFSSCTGPLATALNKDKNGNIDNLCSQRLAWLRGKQQVTNATWLANTATFTVPGHGLVSGDSVVISGVTPSGYNGTFTVTVTGINSFTVNIPTDPGSFVSTATGIARYANFRIRSSVLGDIMNSNPVYSHKDNFGYGNASVTVTGKSDYDAYVASKATRSPVVLVGANDGMLHGFGASASGDYAGKELFAFIPAGVYGNLSKLTSPNYEHRFYVDGSPTVGDAYIGGWKTYLVGGLGAGGRSVFALDISNASQFANSSFNIGTFSPSGMVKWEYSDSDLGLTYSQPQIAPNTTSQWAAIFGNGYNSDSDMAYLYVVNLSNGTLISKVGAGSATSNGLATPYLYDNNGDKIPDIAYAGDLKGNLWKFVNTSGTWTLGNSGNPLFIAKDSSGNTQPITSRPSVLAHPNGGVLIYFGTGRYLTNSDLTDTQSQSLYAIWDNGVTSPTLLRANLQQQTLSTSGSFRTVSSTPPNWASQRGSYVDLPAVSGTPTERALTSPLTKHFSTLDERVVFVTTVPTSDPCDRGGISWLIELSSTLGMLSAPALDTNGDNTIDNTDDIVAGKALPSEIGLVLTAPTWLEGGENNSGFAFKFFTGSKGSTHTEKQTSDPEPPAGGGINSPVRVYWRQIM